MAKYLRNIDPVQHRQGKLKHSPQQQLADAMALEPFVYGQRGDAQDGEEVGWQTPTQGFRHRLRSHLATGDCHKTRDVVGLDRDIGTTDMVTELVLPGAWPNPRSVQRVLRGLHNKGSLDNKTSVYI
jgi:hypothetical protein